MKGLSVEAWILWVRPCGEHDSAICVYTGEMGKIKAIASGTRKISSKLRYLLLPFAQVRLELYKKRDNPWARIIGGNLVLSFQDLYTDFVKMTEANWICELLDKLTPLEQPSLKKYELISQAFKCIAYNNNPNAVSIGFGLQLINYTGHKLELEHCNACQSRYVAADSVWLNNGGILCPICRIRNSTIMQLDVRSLHALKEVYRNPWSLAEYPKNSIELKSLENLLRFLLGHYLYRPLKTDAFKKKVSRL